MADSRTPDTEPLVDEDDVKAREREKLDIGDSHPEDPELRPEGRGRDPDDLDLGDPDPADPEV
jgi:hypothetical protein